MVGSSGNSQDSASMLSVGVSHCFEENYNSVNGSLRKFWSLGNMGLEDNEHADSKAIIDKFESELQFVNGRY